MKNSKHSNSFTLRGARCRHRLCLLIASIVVIAALPIIAQQTGNSIPQADPGPGLVTLTAHVDEVDIMVTALTRSHVPALGLTADDIEVLDNSKPPEAIVRFERRTDVPLRIGILVDCSDSVEERF